MGRVRFENGRRVIERWDRVFRAVSAEPRRQVVIALLDAPQGQSVSLPESAMSPTVPVDPDALREALVHKHLPMLADPGFVEWSADPLDAVRGPRFEEVAVVFEALYSQAAEIPDPLVEGCQRLVWERQFGTGE